MAEFADKVTSFMHDRCGDFENAFVALSGGADSTALLLFIKSICDNTEQSVTGRFVTAIHVNHNLRGAESLRDENFCKQLCEKLGVPLKVVSVNVKAYAKETGKSIEESARILRYKAIENITENSGDGKFTVFTAHNADDNAETVLYNLIRGSGITGLCGIPPVRGNICRPFLSVKRSEILEYLADNNQDYIVDSSNFDNKYTRNYIRNEIIPLLKNINPSVVDSISKTAGIMYKTDCFIKETAKKTDIAASPSVIRREAILLFLRKNKIEPDYTKISLLETSIVNTGKAKVEFSKNLYICFNGKNLYIEEKKENLSANPQIIIKYDENITYGDKRIKLKRIINKNSDEKSKFHNLLTNNLLDCDRIEGEIILRHRKNGDKFIKNGNTFHSKLKTLYNEKLTPEERSGNLVLCDDSGIIWVEHFGASVRCAVSEHTVNAATVEIKTD
ncbi:MAG: tRNA lysidine(34) synthetase TilS [Ruminococcus sp.]|nr:tRNA lysidine(34) synthetase TilS [Ruminococcus sp.]